MKNGMIIDTLGHKKWYKDDKLHRENDLPAIEYSNGNKCWFINDKLHRLNGPAIEWTDSSKEYWINNKRYSKSEFDNYLKENNLKTSELPETKEEINNHDGMIYNPITKTWSWF